MTSSSFATRDASVLAAIQSLVGMQPRAAELDGSGSATVVVRNLPGGFVRMQQDAGCAADEAASELAWFLKLGTDGNGMTHRVIDVPRQGLSREVVGVCLDALTGATRDGAAAATDGHALEASLARVGVTADRAGGSEWRVTIGGGAWAKLAPIDRGAVLWRGLAGGDVDLESATQLAKVLNWAVPLVGFGVDGHGSGVLVWAPCAGCVRAWAGNVPAALRELGRATGRYHHVFRSLKGTTVRDALLDWLGSPAEETRIDP